MSYDFVGICIPVYERISMLKRALTSIWNQDYQNYIVIITDDSISDDIELYIKSLSNSKIIYERNRARLGATDNTNKAIEVARRYGVDLIKILYQDDCFFCREALGTMVKHLVASNLDVVFCGNYEEGFRGESNKHICSKEDIDSINKDLSTLFRANLLGAPSNILFKTCDIMLDSKFSWMLDVDFYIRLLDKKKMGYIFDALIIIGHDGSQLSDYFYRYPYKMFFEKCKMLKKYEDFRTLNNYKYIARYAIECMKISYRRVNN